MILLRVTRVLTHIYDNRIQILPDRQTNRTNENIQSVSFTTQQFAINNNESSFRQVTPTSSICS